MPFDPLAEEILPDVPLPEDFLPDPFLPEARPDEAEPADDFKLPVAEVFLTRLVAEAPEAPRCLPLLCANASTPLTYDVPVSDISL